MDMLIKLYAIPQAVASEARPEYRHLCIRKPIGSEHEEIARWVAEQFGAAWASELRSALGNRPVTAWVAVEKGSLRGFACYDATARGMVGPIGVARTHRTRGLGAALLMSCLQDMRSVGYGYAVAGWVGAAEFFRKVAGATEIPDSTPGLYAGRIGSSQ